MKQCHFVSDRQIVEKLQHSLKTRTGKTKRPIKINKSKVVQKWKKKGNRNKEKGIFSVRGFVSYKISTWRWVLRVSKRLSKSREPFDQKQKRQQITVESLGWSKISKQQWVLTNTNLFCLIPLKKDLPNTLQKTFFFIWYITRNSLQKKAFTFFLFPFSNAIVE